MQQKQPPELLRINNTSGLLTCEFLIDGYIVYSVDYLTLHDRMKLSLNLIGPLFFSPRNSRIISKELIIMFQNGEELA